MFNFDLSGIQLILLLLKFCGKSLSKTSYLFRKQLISSQLFHIFFFQHNGFYTLSNQLLCILKRRHWTTLNPATKKEKNLHFGTSQRLYQIRQQCDKVLQSFQSPFFHFNLQIPRKVLVESKKKINFKNGDKKVDCNKRSEQYRSAY